jgi:hypothetical protein
MPYPAADAVQPQPEACAAQLSSDLSHTVWLGLLFGGQGGPALLACMRLPVPILTLQACERLRLLSCRPWANTIIQKCLLKPTNATT